jgi:hypothetical protein
MRIPCLSVHYAQYIYYICMVRKNVNPVPLVLAAVAERSQAVLRQRDLLEAWNGLVSTRAIPTSVSFVEFMEILLTSKQLERAHFALPHRAETLYLWGRVPDYAVASAIKSKGYLSHFTAMHIYGLTDQVPEVIYVNHEQRPLPSPLSPLTQQSIDAAFRGKQRQTTNIAPWRDRTVCVLNGKFTNQLGAVTQTIDANHEIRVTDLERTLIDITVRPAYSGGVANVLEAFRRAASSLSVNKLTAYLRTIKFVYPYAQALGFYLERAGVSPSRFELLRDQPFEFDFYLAHGLKRTTYVPEWRLHIPEGL